MNQTYFIMQEKNNPGNENNSSVNEQDVADDLNIDSYEPMEDLFRDNLYVWKLLFLLDKVD